MMHTTQNGQIARSKILALGMLLALMAASLMLASSQARASTTFTVNSTADAGDNGPGDGLCFTGQLIPLPSGGIVGECTLRAAIQEANATSGADTINFDIPGSGVKTITPASQLPSITGTVSIDGYSQPGAKPNQKAVGTDAVLKIELSGAEEQFYVDGLVVDAANSTVKGLVINDFGYSGIFLHAGAVGSKIEGNYIGTDPSGTQDLSNGDDGVTIVDSDQNTVGGTSAAARNLISGNTDAGVDIHSANNQVRGNLIGTQKDGTTALGNKEDGVKVYGGSSTVAGNTVAFNGEDGVAVLLDAKGNSILSNSIYNNAEEGIDFGDDGPTANDPGDGDDGPNNLQNKPVLSSAKKSATGTTVRGNLNSTPNKTFQLQFFSNPEGTNEGKTLLGSKSVSTNGTGNVSFTFSTTKTIRLGQNITATATGPGGNTSEFSAPRKVVAQ